MTRFGKFVTQNAVWAFEKVGIVPKGTYDVGEALKTAGKSTRVSFSTRADLEIVVLADALVAGGQEKLFTPMMVRCFRCSSRRS